MKNIIAILALIATGFGPSIVHGQITTPPFGSVKSGGNDASFLNYYFIKRTDVAGVALDTVAIRPYHRRVTMKLSVQDSCILYLSSVAGCYYTDQLDLDVICPPQNGTLYLAGPWNAAGDISTINLAAGMHFLIRFYFDGTNWVEYARNANY